ncbi:MAG: DNA polymerase III subunit delta', partial [Proteobacteria bacterium]|nr:DNA polymerase III subunit delta' [Pseudomonadota bacterium]MBU1612118.1 DNA polymerase III subunit delta' [Pseudomonadota bacterium]
MEGGGHIDIRGAIHRQRLVVERLGRLAANPPQSLLLEGGTDEERRGVARWWAALLNCERPEAGGTRPCLECSCCRKIAENTFSDLIIMDEAYYEEKKSRLSVAAVRALMPTWGQPPSGDGYRVTQFPFVRDMSIEVSNTLLKTLEEPRPGNVFVLMTPQRERLLPTLISRSWVFTLAWPETADTPADAQQLARELVGYWRTGRGWFEHSQAKIAAPLALDLVNHMMSQVRDAMVARPAAGPQGEVAVALMELFDAKGFRKVDLALTKAQEALSLSPSP